MTSTESVFESAALAWLGGIGLSVLHGPSIVTDTPGVERRDHGEVVLALRLRNALLPELISGEIRGKGAAERTSGRPDG